MDKFKNKLKRILQEIYLFLTSKIFLKNFAGMIAIFLGILTISFWWMKSYTHHGESLEVPSFLNMDIHEAFKKAQQHKLKAIINDSTWRDGIKPGTVLEQNPDPQSQVKEERTIYLTIMEYTPKKKKLPPLAGNDDYKMYERKLRKLDLKLKVKEKKFNNKLEENTILYLYVDGERKRSKDLDNGVEVAQGSVVEAVVTTKGGARVNIPNLVCRKYNEAEFIVGGSQLSVSLIKDGTVQSLDDAYVWKQSPAYSSEKTLSVGSVIDVYITRRLPENCN